MALLPPIRRKVFEPLWASTSGSPFVRYWHEVEPVQFLPADEIAALQWERTKAILDHAYWRVPFYRERFEAAGVSPGSIQEPADLRALPVLRKADIRENVPQMIAEGHRREDLKLFQTGGSTGTALDIYITEECSERRNAVARRHDRWTGWEVGEPRGMLWVDFRKGLKSHVRSWALDSRIHLNTLRFNREAVEVFASQWARVEPTLLTGHAQALFRLAQYVEEFSIDEIRPRGILSTVMTLRPEERQKIETVFGAKVIDRYGCEEVSLIGCECEKHEGMHLNTDNLFIEFIAEDGQPAKPGQPGKIVVTDLHNLAMPFIRYQVEDVGVPTDRVCSCGRGLPLMDGLLGRSADFLVRKDGSLIAGISILDKTLLAVPGTKQMQIVQGELEHFVVRVVPEPEYFPEGDRLLEAQMRKEFGDEVAIEIEHVDAIAPEKSGKYRFTISKVDNGFR